MEGNKRTAKKFIPADIRTNGHIILTLQSVNTTELGITCPQVHLYLQA